jgi:hypothetical protein
LSKSGKFGCREVPNFMFKGFNLSHINLSILNFSRVFI